ncbi:uncharacterized protein RBU33_010674 [Hipposideros larvatus]
MVYPANPEAYPANPHGLPSKPRWSTHANFFSFSPTIPSLIWTPALSYADLSSPCLQDSRKSGLPSNHFEKSPPRVPESTIQALACCCCLQTEPGPSPCGPVWRCCALLSGTMRKLRPKKKVPEHWSHSNAYSELIRQEDLSTTNVHGDTSDFWRWEMQEARERPVHDVETLACVLKEAGLRMFLEHYL